MNRSDDEKELTDEELRSALRDVGARARRDAFALGRPVVFLRGSQFVWLYPDGHEVCEPAPAEAASEEQMTQGAVE